MPSPCKKYVPTFSIPITNKTVLIDAGHGGSDSGAIANGMLEKDLNLKIALKLQALVEESGGTAVLTRIEDRSTATPKRKKDIYDKHDDLAYRKKLMIESKADIFVSIHMNACNDSSCRGVQVYYSSNGLSENLGKTLQKSIYNTTKYGQKWDAKELKNGVYLLKGAKIPAALVECGFITNWSEARLLKSENYQRKVAWGIYTGITEYFANEQAKSE
jgi:N-acetylmuramoyl-L-alanine amidase